MKRRSVLNAAALSIAILFLSGVPARASQKSAGDGPVIKVGEKAPSFKLKDQNGKEHTLQSLIQNGKVALVFYRSASW